MNEKEVEQMAMILIANSGDARSFSFQALAKAKKGLYEEAEELMKQAEHASLIAHKSQTELLISEASGKQTQLSILLVHAQDHLMTSLLAKELIKEIIVLHRGKQDKEVS